MSTYELYQEQASFYNSPLIKMLLGYRFSIPKSYLFFIPSSISSSSFCREATSHVKVKYHTFYLICILSLYHLILELFINLAFPLPDRFYSHFPCNILNMFSFLTKPRCQKLSKLSGYQQTDRQTYSYNLRPGA